ncbi:MAG: type II 3-dehydroquinate dehydratase [Clostridia bacterium]|nr:type II 3-dehydroquinate dehydratase [Clostridia bacterium]
MKLLVLNGPNLNMLGIREPGIYGNKTYEDLISLIRDHCEMQDVDVAFFQSNHEGELVERIQQAYFDKVDGMVLNPAAYTHTSVAILDALKSVMIPTVEVHLSDLSTRESFRQVSFVREACIKTIQGHGFQGYLEAVDVLIAYVKGERAKV